MGNRGIIKKWCYQAFEENANILCDDLAADWRLVCKISENAAAVCGGFLETMTLPVASMASKREKDLRNHFLRLFKACPIPENELFFNLGLFINRQSLSRIILCTNFTGRFSMFMEW